MKITQKITLKYKFSLIISFCIASAALSGFGYISRENKIKQTEDIDRHQKSDKTKNKNWRGAKIGFIFSSPDYYTSSSESSVQSFESSHFIKSNGALFENFKVVQTVKDSNKLTTTSGFMKLQSPSIASKIVRSLPQTNIARDDKKAVPNFTSVVTHSVNTASIDVPIPYSKPNITNLYGFLTPPKDILPYKVQNRVPAPTIQMLITKYAKLYQVPEKLVHRVANRESGYNPNAYNKGNFGLMQIRYNTAKALGYSGPPHGLLDAETNLKYAVKYLRGAWLVAGNEDGAVGLYSRGYYYDAKRKGMLNVFKK